MAQEMDPMAKLNHLNWQPDSWHQLIAAQQAVYDDSQALSQVIGELSQLPPLVSVNEIDDLRLRIASAAKGESFVLQGGDCAEMFSDCNADVITGKLKILIQMSLILVYGLKKPVTKIGRLAGQYAKPRSQQTEMINGQELPCYRGDLINSAEVDLAARRADPKRLLKGYSFASLTLNYIRTLFDDHFSDLSNIDNWDLDFVSHSSREKEYQAIIQQIKISQSLINNLAPQNLTQKLDDKIFTCHEALHLHYEQALTRQQNNGQWYNLSTHLPWIGMRTCQLDSAHVEYMRGIANPIAVKIGPAMSSEHLLHLCDQLDPDNQPGRLTLITRFGAEKIEQHLAPLIKALQKQDRQPLWCCDPMHGNTCTTQQGVKTRNFDDIIKELTRAIQIHRDASSHLGGVHFELTGDHVTECTGGARGLTELDLARRYKSLVDPRLNADQSLEMAMRLIQLSD